MPQATGVEERSTPNSGEVRDLTMAKPGAAAASSSPVPATAGATPARVASLVSTSDAEPPASTARTTTSDPSVASARSADVPVTGAAASAGLTAITAATPDQPSADVQAAAVAATVTPAATVAANATRGDELSVKGRSAAAHPQQRHGLQATVSRDTEKGQRGAAVDASANVAAADDQRRNGSPADADMSGSKPAAASAGSDILPHEAPPPTSATRVVHPTVTAMPAIDGVRQVPVDRAPLAEASPAPAADVPDADTPHRLVQSLRMQFLRGGGDAIVQLRPEHLGQVTVSLRVEQGSVAARITAADPVVAEWLQAHQGSLRDGLQANGLTLERLSIDRDGRSPDRRERRQPPPRQRFRQAAETQSTFELTI
jgi:flagellar hook-length control protein FliK